MTDDAKACVAKLKAERDTMVMLRQNAIEASMLDLAITYGWSALRLGFECLEAFEL